MTEIKPKKWGLQTVRVLLLLVIIVVSLGLWGCSGKSTVIYTPHEESSQSLNIQPLQVLDENEDIAEALREYFTSWQGTRYRYGGLSHKGVDCSGFAMLTYKDVFGKNLPRTVRGQMKEGIKIPKASMQAGDLVFFKTGLFQKHVGIYLEDDLFMHASQSKGVIISSLNNVYWQKKFWQVQRVQSAEQLGKLSSEILRQAVATDS